jgi:endonuclease/exonuclease/phosphatase family metal-dependent hydrolase
VSRLRVVTYNVHGLKAGVSAADEALAGEGIDLALLQECGSRHRMRGLARSLGMEAVSSHRGFLGGLIRNAVLFRPPWRLHRVEVHRFARQTRTRPRGLIAAHLRATGVPLTAVAAHLGLAPRERERHARELTDFLAGMQTTVVLGVDLNEGPDDPAARWIGERYFDAFAAAGEGVGETFPSHDPAARIDYLFVSEGLRVLRSGVPPAGAASDHLPVVAELELP